jgi:hypothetical protein
MLNLYGDYNQEIEYMFKVALIGESAAGKPNYSPDNKKKKNLSKKKKKEEQYSNKIKTQRRRSVR